MKAVLVALFNQSVLEALQDLCARSEDCQLVFGDQPGVSEMHVEQAEVPHRKERAAETL